MLKFDFNLVSKKATKKENVLANALAFIYSNFLNYSIKGIDTIRVLLVDENSYYLLEAGDKPMKGFLKVVYVTFNEENYFISSPSKKVEILVSSIEKTIPILVEYYAIDRIPFDTALKKMLNNECVIKSLGKKVYSKSKKCSFQLFQELSVDYYKFGFSIQIFEDSPILATLINAEPLDLFFNYMTRKGKWLNETEFTYFLDEKENIVFFVDIKDPQIIRISTDSKKNISWLKRNAVNNEERNRLDKEIEICELIS